MAEKKDSLHRWLIFIVSIVLPGISLWFGLRWFYGLGLIAVSLGSGITYFVQKGLRRYVKSYGIESSVFPITDFQKKRHTFQPFLVGVFERTFFTILIAFHVEGVGAGLILWITVKMLSGWNRYKRDTLKARVRAFNALMMNLTSLIFAVLGGSIINCDIPLLFLF